MSNTSKMYQPDIKAPIAKKEKHVISTHGDDRVDNYYWMRLTDEQKTAEKLDAHTQEVVDYLNSENDYVEKVTAHLKPFQNKLYDEIVGRIKQTDMLQDVIQNTTGGATWANDNKTVFYTRKDDALRSFKIFKHKIGTPASEDVEVFHETDETFNAFVYKTKSEKYIIVGSWATLSQEYQILDADKPDGDLKMFQPRVRNLEYSIGHYGDKWYIRTNKDGAQNFKIMTTTEESTTKENWVDYIDHRDDVFLEGTDFFKDYFVLSERIDGITKVRIMKWDGSDDHHINFGEDAYLAYTTTNLEFATNQLRVGFTSLTTPNTTFDYDMNSRSLRKLKQQEVIGEFVSDDYVSERIIVAARDGARVPVSIVYKKGFEKNGKQPLLLYGYGSYGNSMDPYFSSVRLSLLDRGFAFAIAHIRGGQEMGYHWRV